VSAGGDRPPQRLEVWAPDGIGEVRPGDDLAALVGDALDGAEGVRDGDVVVVTSKVVSKAEGQVVAAADREQAITDETVRVVATRPHDGGVLRIVQNRLGLVMAAAGVDASNTPEGTVLLLPADPDASARALRAELQARFGVRLAVVVGHIAVQPAHDGPGARVLVRSAEDDMFREGTAEAYARGYADGSSGAPAVP